MGQRQPQVVQRHSVGHRVEVSVRERPPVGRDARVVVRGHQLGLDQRAGVPERHPPGGVRLGHHPHRQRILELAMQVAASSLPWASSARMPLDRLLQAGHRPGLGHRRVERLDVSEHALERQRRRLIEADQQPVDGRQRQRRGAQGEGV